MSYTVFQPLVLVEGALHQVYTAATWCESVRVRVSPQTLGKYTLAVVNVYILLQSDDVLAVTVS